MYAVTQKCASVRTCPHACTHARTNLSHVESRNGNMQLGRQASLRRLENSKDLPRDPADRCRTSKDLESSQSPVITYPSSKSATLLHRLICCPHGDKELGTSFSFFLSLAISDTFMYLLYLQRFENWFKYNQTYNYYILKLCYISLSNKKKLRLLNGIRKRSLKRSRCCSRDNSD